MLIKDLNIKYIPQMVEIENLCFSAPWSYDNFICELENPFAIYFLILQDEAVCGYIGAHNILGECYITNVAVHPSFRKGGVATELLAALINFTKSENCLFLTLEVRTSNAPAISLYKKYNFKITGRRKNFYTHPTEDAYIMTLEVTL